MTAIYTLQSGIESVFHDSSVLSHDAEAFQKRKAWYEKRGWEYVGATEHAALSKTTLHFRRQQFVMDFTREA